MVVAAVLPPTASHARGGPRCYTKGVTRTTLDALVARVPQWEGHPTTLRPLAGVPGRHYVVGVGGREYVVRAPGLRAQLLGFEQANETESATRAAQLGIGPPVVGELPETRTLITLLVGGHHLDPDRFVERLPDIVATLRTFHDSGPVKGSFPIHRVVEWHARDASSHGFIAPAAYERLHQQSRRIEAAFAKAPTPAVPCHNDLVTGNLLFDDGHVWLLDFECAGMNDRFFDLGNLSANNGFDRATDEHLLSLYFGEVSRSAIARLELMKFMSRFRDGMWAVVQRAVGSTDDELAAQADQRFAACERAASQPAFEMWLVDAGRAPFA